MTQTDEEDQHARDRAAEYLRGLKERRRMKMADVESLSPSEVLADVVVTQALPASLRRGIASGRRLSAIIKVPEADWVEPIADAIQTLERTEGRMWLLQRDAVQKDKKVHGLIDRLADGRPVVAVSNVPEGSLPEVLLNIAETRIDIPRLDAKTMVTVLGRTQRGRVPEEAKSYDYGLLSFAEACALLEVDGHAKDTVASMKRVIDSKAYVGRRSDALPSLEEAVEYGEARLWALNLRDDLRDLKLKKILPRDVDKGAIFYGPPGTGKTLLGRMIGEACGIPTVVGSIGELFAGSSGYLDAVIKAQRALFQEAMVKSPSILFLDELNSLPNVDNLGRRNRDYWLPIITDFYTLLDGALSERSGVIVIGATNRIQDIHPAILRPGRMERKLFVGPPDAVGAERILRHHLGEDLRGHDISRVAAIAAAHESTGAVIEENVRAARRTARRAGRPMSARDLETQVAPAETRSAADIERVSIHEAGHAVAYTMLGLGEIKSMSMIENGSSGGFIELPRNVGLLTRSQTHAHVKSLLAGQAAEALLLGEPSHGAGGSEDSDLAQATMMIGMSFVSTGLEGPLIYRGGADRVSELIGYDADLRQRVEKVLQRLLFETKGLLSDHRADILRLARTLADRRFLSGTEVMELLGGGRVSP